MNRDLRIVGVDPSLTSTGVSDGQSVHAFQTTPGMPMAQRLLQLVNRVSSFVTIPSQWGLWPLDNVADLVVIEGSAFSRSGPGHEELNALRWMLRVEMWKLDVPVAVVAPTALKKYTTGDGRAGKPEMVQAVLDRHGVDLAVHRVKDGRYDMADAYALAAMGYARYEQPLKTFGPPGPMKSLLALDWPVLPEHSPASSVL